MIRSIRNFTITPPSKKEKKNCQRDKMLINTNPKSLKNFGEIVSFICMSWKPSCYLYSAPNAYHTIMQNASPSSTQPPPPEYCLVDGTDRFKPWYILIQSQLNHICQLMRRILSFVIKQLDFKDELCRVFLLLVIVKWNNQRACGLEKQKKKKK